MGIADICRVTGSARNAQSRHLDLSARNMANAQVVSGTEQTAFRAGRPVFAPLLEQGFDNSGVAGVEVAALARSQADVPKQLMPEHPLADQDGYVYLSNVNMVEEMTNMIQASRNYQSNVEVMNTSKELMLRTLSMGS